ncbi:Epidermal growth factor-like protein 6 [Varanus komodoensis]|nr:Epidermal growth factor-like protein 6 [Varanus komodoensis]
MLCFMHSSRGGRSLLSLNQPGVCRYGSKLDCCHGWKRNSKEHCEGNGIDLSLLLASLHSEQMNKGERTHMLQGKVVRKREEGEKNNGMWVIILVSPRQPKASEEKRVLHETAATCEHGCKYGECVMANKCKCFPGFTGKTCSQGSPDITVPMISTDINECGLKPYPCEHRCMNTHGSYKCYCLNGYMLLPDGTCTIEPLTNKRALIDSRTCAMVNCQYGCQEVKDDVRCLCPSSGLQLAPNGKTCIDIDECATGKAICSFNRRCVNTFGSYYCKCQIGYELKHVSGRYDCLDVNECVTNIPKCNFHAECLNTQGSFKCKCKPGYRGNGFRCAVIPDNSVKGVLRISGIAKEKLKKLLVHKNSMKKHEDQRNAIPEPPMTPTSKVYVRPVDNEDGVYAEDALSEQRQSTVDIRRDGNVKEKGDVKEEGQKEHPENQTGHEKTLRGDVFCKFNLYISLSSPTVHRILKIIYDKDLCGFSYVTLLSKDSDESK